MTGKRHHPWRLFRSLTDWTLEWRELPFGVWGQTCFQTNTVTLTLGLTQAERRCTIQHEMEHIHRGPIPVGREAHEEQIVDRRTARILLPDVREVGDALAWSPNLFVAAQELWVDEFVLGERLRSLHPSERHFLWRRLARHDVVCEAEMLPHVGQTLSA